ncbi:MAG: hypothetical protein IPH22_09715 [Nitrosomonas sp.]|nr:hypothetical protein [Nitrosomonas sp.]
MKFQFPTCRGVSLQMCAFVLALITAGCATTRSPIEEEELFSWFGYLNYSYLSTAPERRVVLFRYKDDLVCAEPPADAADQVASMLNAGLRADKASIGVQGELQQELATTIKQLSRRTQALQLYRDRVSMLCLMLMNRMIDKDQYNDKESKAFDASIKLLEIEIPEFYKVFPKEYDNPNSPKTREKIETPSSTKTPKETGADPKIE